MPRWLLVVLLICFGLTGAGALAGAQTAPADDSAMPVKPAPKPAVKKPAKPAAKPAATPVVATPAPPMTPEQAARQAYRAQLSIDLQRMQATLVKQQADLATQQDKLKQFYSSMIEAVSKSETDAAPDSTASPAVATTGAAGKKDLPPAVKASVSYEAQTYQVQVARTAVLTTQREIVRLQGFLAQIQP
jgi:hypothetical protein